MSQVPQFGREVSPQLTPTPYKRAYINPVAFGENVAHAQGQIANAMGGLGDVMAKIQTRIDDTKILELTNHSNDWREQNLYDKENGFFYKTGKDAYGQSEALLKNYDEYMNDYIKSAKLSPAARSRAVETVAKMKQGMIESITSHDFKQGIAWSNSVASTAQNNYLNNAVNMRNNPEEIARSLQSGYQIIEWQGELQNLDDSAIAAAKMKYRSDLHCSVLDAKIAEGSLTASQYFDEHKTEIDPDKIPNYLKAIKNNELRYESVDIAGKIVATSQNEEEAYNQANNIDDVDMQDHVKNRLHQYYSEQEKIKKLHEKENLKNFYDKALSAQQQGTMLCYDDIPSDLDPDVQLSLMNYINNNYQPETDNTTYEDLFEMRHNNAQGFLDTDLNRYRGFLSEKDYRYFLKEQENLKKGNYHSNIKDEDMLKKINEAMDVLGVKYRKKGENVMLSETKSLIREFEARKGRKATNEEINNLINSLGYKGSDGVYLYKQYEKGMAKRTGFMKDVVNDIVYYQNKHNGEFPNDKEFSLILNNRVIQEAQKQRTNAEQVFEGYRNRENYINLIGNTTSKPNEQKVTTYFADTVAPELSKKLGFDVRVTSRYRNSAGSKHAEGRAVDIGMAKETPAQRIQIYEELIKLPYIKAIGCSDAKILAHFNGRTNKIIDERKYDLQHGTNHVNHAHVTFLNDSDIIRTDGQKIAANNGIYEL